MSRQRIVITGMGWVNPLAHDVPGTWAGLLSGRSGMGRISRFDASTFKTDFAAEVKGYTLPPRLANDPRHADAGFNARFALGAASQAFEQAGLAKHLADGASFKVQPRRFGLYLGSGEGTLDFDNYAAAHVAGWNEAERTLNGRVWAETAYRRMVPQREIEQEANITLSHVAWAFGCRGPASNCLTACAASNQAIGEACDLLHSGEADVMFAGGAHTMIHPLGVTGFIRLTALSSRREDPTKAARPFDQTRDGFVMGEGAGMLVLETEDHARARGAAILAEVAGYGSSADAFRTTDMHPEGRGPQAAMMGALRRAGINPREPDSAGRTPVQYIAAHGTGTKENDKIETHAIKHTFGPHAPHIPVSSIKSMMGHLIAAAGVSGVITCVQAIRTGHVPPTINYGTPDANLDLDYVPNTSRAILNERGQSAINACLCNAYGFGGQNDCLVIRAAG
ncbi:MAG: beta-ketoacyl-[acyl-carrier-protein] synthase family protein [Phycisphaerales bacterium]